MIATTLQRLKDAGACKPRYKHLCEALGEDFGKTASLPLAKILETNGRNNVLWALDNAIDGGESCLRLWAADCAEHVQHIWLKYYPNDKRPQQAIDAARQFARGQITKAAKAAEAAKAAAWGARGARAARAARATWAGETAAKAAARVEWAAARAAWAAARVKWTAAEAAEAAAVWAVWAVVAGEARTTEKKWQTDRLVAYLNEEVTEDWHAESQTVAR
jgi:hypothetical protein